MLSECLNEWNSMSSKLTYSNKLAQNQCCHVIIFRICVYFDLWICHFEHLLRNSFTICPRSILELKSVSILH